MTKEVLQNFSALSKRLSAVEKQFSDFTEMLHERNASDILFLSMETGVDLDIGEDEEPEDFLGEEGE